MSTYIPDDEKRYTAASCGLTQAPSELCKKVEPPAVEFTTELRNFSNQTQDASASSLYLECADRLDAQRQEIEKLQNCMKALWSENKAQAERIEKLEKAVSLLNSMVLCRDDHSVISRQVVEQALKGE